MSGEHLSLPAVPLPVPRRPAPPAVRGDAPAGAVPASALNRRDLEVLRCLVEGRSTAQIAASLSVSTNTARTRIRRVQAKLGVAGREAAVQAARDLGVLAVPPRRSAAR
ncbi:helix-turn-helix domain-containing protein [Geodermatophilus marinus]|uniref:helix-turn-helix domain-containing protein n=1 Tax=Geodermatophilus sp. LHW52908 TaxID=2303986 RepID=UPI000E3C02C6|nr:helix-turn-helix transcriptional regulator [Geodermatophilus sp. LHW52908]RFU19686.1 LuxR family transcriptional regulator [Geodermatophilus sp. LHW52908]